MAATEAPICYVGIVRKSAAFRLMKQMGWEEGEGLGKEKQGIRGQTRHSSKQQKSRMKLLKRMMFKMLILMPPQRLIQLSSLLGPKEGIRKEREGNLSMHILPRILEEYLFFQQLLALFSIHQMSLSLFRFVAAVGGKLIVVCTLGTCTLIMNILLGGFIVAQNDIEPFMIWGYYISPVMYGQNALVINEFLDKRWSAPNPDPRIHAPTVGKVLLKSRGFFTDDYMFWVCVGALLGFSLLFNILFIAALTFLNPRCRSSWIKYPSSLVASNWKIAVTFSLARPWLAHT